MKIWIKVKWSVKIYENYAMLTTESTEIFTEATEHDSGLSKEKGAVNFCALCVISFVLPVIESTVIKLGHISFLFPAKLRPLDVLIQRSPVEG